MRNFLTLLLVAASLSASAGTLVKIFPVDGYSNAPFVNEDYGLVEFFAIGPSGQFFHPDETNMYYFEDAGTYRITGQTVYNFCYPSEVKLEIDLSQKYIEINQPVECE